jgi:hypothetical protein
MITLFGGYCVMNLEYYGLSELAINKIWILSGGI